MRVAQIIDGLHAHGGAERLQLLFAATVADSDVQLTVVTLRESDPAVVEALESLGVRVGDPEADVVGDRAEVTDMVVEALQLEQQGTQPLVLLTHHRP